MAQVTAKVFESGRSQAVRIPKAYRFRCDEVLIEKKGRSLVLTPKPKTWREYFSQPARLSADFRIPDDPPVGPIKRF